MLPYGFNWGVIRLKEGDDKIVTLSPVERSALVSLMINFKVISEHGGVPQMADDKDNFDAMVDSIIQKLIT